MTKYTKQTWTDGSGGGTPISAARLGVIETGVFDGTFGRSTTFPATPVDGQLHQYPADTTNGVMWLFIYNSGSASAHKWECVSPQPLYAEVETGETTASTTYAALATAGPSIALPKAGDYMVEIGAHMTNTGANGNLMSYDIGGTAAVDADAIQVSVATAAFTWGNSRSRRKAGLTAVTLTSKYKVGAGTGTFSKRWMKVTPIRVTP